MRGDIFLEPLQKQWISRTIPLLLYIFFLCDNSIPSKTGVGLWSPHVPSIVAIERVLNRFYQLELVESTFLDQNQG